MFINVILKITNIKLLFHLKINIMNEFNILLDSDFPSFSALDELLRNGMQDKLHEENINVKFIISYYNPKDESKLTDKKFDLFLLNTKGSIRTNGFNIKNLKENFGKEKSIFILHQCDCGCDKTINEIDEINVFQNQFIGNEVLINVRNTIIKMCTN